MSSQPEMEQTLFMSGECRDMLRSCTTKNSGGPTCAPPQPRWLFNPGLMHEACQYATTARVTVLVCRTAGRIAPS